MMHVKSRPEQPSHDSANQQQSNVFFSGVAVLTLSTVLVKVIGLLYKIPMLHYLGNEGMGYFNAAYEWYALLCMIATAGLPIATSMLIAEARSAGRYDDVKRIEGMSQRLFVALGAIGTALLLFGARAFAYAIGSPDTQYALMAVAPTLLFSCLSGAYRGYFQGFQNMVPTAVSQIIEALGKLILGLVFGVIAWWRGLSTPMIAAWAMLGLSIGVALSVVYLMLYRVRFSRRPPETVLALALADARDRQRGEVTYRRLLTVAVPLTLSSSVLSLTKIFDMTMILRRLQDVGYDVAQANALYGGYTTMVVPIFNLIPSLITSVALALVPALTAAIEAGDSEQQKSTVRSAIRLTALLALPATLAVGVYSRPILRLLFHEEAAALDVAAPLLSMLSVSIFFSCVITTTNAVLQAYGKIRTPIASMLAGAAVKLVSAYVLIGIPQLNIGGAPISTLLCSGVIVGYNLYVIARTTDAMESLRAAFIRPLLVALPAIGVPAVIYRLLVDAGYHELLMFGAAIPLTIFLYVVLCLWSRLLGREQLALLPGRSGVKLLRIYRRFRHT